MQKIYWEGEKNNNRRVVVSAWARNNRDMSERQGLYSFFIGGGVGRNFPGWGLVGF